MACRPNTTTTPYASINSPSAASIPIPAMATPSSTSGDTHLRYKQAREQAYKAVTALDEKEKEFEERLYRLVQHEKAKFKKEVRDIEDFYENAKEEIERTQRRAYREFRNREYDILADPNLTYDQKEEYINQLRNKYDSMVNPSDEYQSYVQQNSIESLLSSFMGPFMNALGGGGGSCPGRLLITNGAPSSGRGMGFRGPPSLSGVAPHSQSRTRPPCARISPVNVEEID